MSGETKAAPSGWTVDTLAEHFQRQHTDLKEMLQERYETQTKAVDAAFLAQQTAMQTALAAAERAVQTALLAVEKSNEKSERANEKRFEGVNEFRGQLADQAALFMTRSEADARIIALAEKLADFDSRTQVSINQLNSRQDLTAGRGQGLNAGWGYLVGAAGFIAAVLAIALRIN